MLNKHLSIWANRLNIIYHVMSETFSINIEQQTWHMERYLAIMQNTSK